ncbi:MAG: hypothetical protein E7E23_04505 [Paenibacillus sp.]|uniref:hypothetical protein n=1 Tax=Paenibacillus sp. TaxID=58172 RepID=UPI00290505A3|nr:hypothetical protein [Paenibacillus sp.]MDU2239817.1 hypothetical protein [Paenibacillus sp.]
MSWIVRESGFDPERIAHHGNKFMIGNGVLGYRGTLEEFGKSELTATIVAGLYDKVGDKWREPVNAPNGLATAVFWDGAPLSVLKAVDPADAGARGKAGEGDARGDASPELVAHEQALDLRRAVHRRRSVFCTADGAEVAITSERFCSAVRPELIVSRIAVESSREGEFTIVTGIDGDVWDINGPHLERIESGTDAAGEVLSLTAWTQELGIPVTVAEAAEVRGGGEHQPPPYPNAVPGRRTGRIRQIRRRVDRTGRGTGTRRTDGSGAVRTGSAPAWLRSAAARARRSMGAQVGSLRHDG